MVLSQDRYSYQHDQVLSSFTSGLSNLLAEVDSICIYVDLPGIRASESPQETVSR